MHIKPFCHISTQITWVQLKHPDLNTSLKPNADPALPAATWFKSPPNLNVIMQETIQNIKAHFDICSTLKFLKFRAFHV